MNDRLKTKYLESINQLLDMAEAIHDQFKKNSKYSPAQYASLQTGGESLILKIAGENSPHYKNFQHIMMSNEDLGYKIPSCYGVLTILKTELEQGLLGEVEDLVRAEVFTDFLETAEYLLEKGYKDPAAVLVSTVLENGLRRIAGKHDIVVKDKDDISSLNTKLGDAKAYSKLDRSQIQTWKKLRDSATHGKYDEYTKPKVDAMLEGVRRFLTEHLR